VKPSKALEKALQILDAYLEHGHSMGVSELSRIVNLPKSTCFRLIKQLAASQYLERIGDDYRLGARVLALGSRYIHMQPGGLADVAAPHLGSLLVHSGFAVHLGVLQRQQVTILARLQTQRMPMPLWAMGVSLPASTSIIGKILLALGPPDAVQETVAAGLPRATPMSVQNPSVFLAQLDRARGQGVAYDLEETIVGVTGIAAPIHWQGRPIAAVSVSGPAERFSPGTAENVLVRTARAIERDFVRQRHLRADARKA